MGWISSDITYDDAVSRGLDIWEVLFDNWGNAAPLVPDPLGLFTFPGIGVKSIPSVFGVSIGSRSMVDRVFVSYDRQKIVNSSYLYFRGASVEAPLLFSQPSAGPAPVAAVPAAPPFSAASVAVYALNQSPILADTSDDSFVFANFRPAGGGGFVDYEAATSFVPPRLQLYFHLKPGIVIPHRRMPTCISQTDPVLLGARRFVASVPVCGRKIVEITTVCTQIADIEIGFVQSATGAAEIIAGTSLAVPALNPRRFVIDPAYGDFVNIYATTAVSGQLLWTVTGQD